MTQILVSLGSNLAKESNLPAAIDMLAAHPQLTVLAVSPILETPAIGADGQPSAQPAFHNAALLAETALSPRQVRELLRSVEAALGRVRSQDKFAPRPIDLDLSFYGDASLDEDGKHLPDPDVLRFAHVAVPLAAVAPTWVHPESGETLAAIARALPQNPSPAR